MSDPALPPYSDTRWRWLIASGVLFLAAMQYAGSGSDRAGRVRGGGALMIGLALL